MASGSAARRAARCEGEAAGLPRWVRRFMIAVVAILALVMLVAGGEHGPGRHLGTRSVYGLVQAVACSAPADVRSEGC